MGLVKSRIMYIERKAGELTGEARIGRVTFSKTGRTLYYGGKAFRSLRGGRHVTQAARMGELA